MRIELTALKPEESQILRQLYEFYAYDFSEMTGRELPDDGFYTSAKNFERVLAAELHLFLLRVDGKLAGFAMVSAESFLTHDPTIRDVSQFFVMRRYRRQGVGLRAAHQMFDLFPGPWEVRQMEANVPAQLFWRKVIGEYTQGNYQEQHLNEERWHGFVQSFGANPE